MGASARLVDLKVVAVASTRGESTTGHQHIQERSGGGDPDSLKRSELKKVLVSRDKPLRTGSLSGLDERQHLSGFWLRELEFGNPDTAQLSEDRWGND